MRRVFTCLSLVVLLSPALIRAKDTSVVNLTKDAETGWTVYELAKGATAIKIEPSAGANVFSIRYKGTELLKSPKSLKELPGFAYGVPVLFPMPNRVRDGVFTYSGREFKFTPNNDGNFLHGLVHSANWEVAPSPSADETPTINCRLKFEPGTEHFKLFPFPHMIQLSVAVTSDGVRWTYTVDNTHGDKAVPFGFALHPWILYQGSRSETYVTIPATHLMESVKLLPTGKLLELTGSNYDARQPKSLEGFLSDDVYFGMRSAAPAVIDFRQPRLKITLSASDDFTHLVLYTPKDQPWFCVENQTCSTDAHNLYTKGLTKESHLQIVEPGKTASGHIEMRFESY